MPKLNDFSRPSAWKSELERSQKLAETYWPDWEGNLRSYIGQSADAQLANIDGTNWVNVNADFKNVEVKSGQLFFEQPELQLSAKGEFKAPPPAAPIPGAPPQPPPDRSPIISAHRELLNELLGPDHADVLTTVEKAIKDCLATAGVGATKIYYEATMESIPTPLQLQMVMPDQGPMINRPVHEKWAWERIPSKKFRIPADFKDTDFDKSPWVAMDFRMPLSIAKRTLKLPADFEGTYEKDDKVLETNQTQRDEPSVPYVDGTEIWYYANIYDKDAINPQLIRRHVVCEGYDEFAEKDPANPFQTLMPNGRLSADSMIGYPIHVLAIRDVPDSAFIPSDETMTRPLVRELCKFRTQQVQERDANIPRVGYDVAKVPPETIKKIEQGTIGSLIPFPEGSLVQGMPAVMAQITQGNQTRGSYTANDYIQHDLDMTLGIDAIGSGVKDAQSATATEIGVVDRQRNVRIKKEQRRVLSWYLKGVAKYSALVCRFMTPELAVPYIGEQAAQAWAQWDKKTWDGRFVFQAKPDSQLSLDAAAERKFYLDLYQFLRRDPAVNPPAVLKPLFEHANIDPAEGFAPQAPPKKPEPSIGITFKGEDLIGPQAQMVIEILGQTGIQVSPEAQQTAASQLFQQMQLGIRDGAGRPVKATPQPAEHGGVSEKVRPMDQQSADKSGQRSGPKTQ